MPLTELALYFNNIHPAPDSALYAREQRLEAWFRDYFLGSHFAPVAAIEHGKILGHQASLTVRTPDGKALGREEVYALCRNADEVVHLDRLCRTLHALNFLAQQRHAGGFLLLAVHPRHLLAIQGQHGLVFEALLKRCGLGPEDIILELAPHPLLAETQLAAAIANYRQRGYRISLAETDTAIPTTSNQHSFVPDFVRHALSSVQTAILPADAPLILSGIDTAADLQRAQELGASLGLGRLYGLPQANCLPTHADQSTRTLRALAA